MAEGQLQASKMFDLNERTSTDVHSCYKCGIECHAGTPCIVLAFCGAFATLRVHQLGPSMHIVGSGKTFGPTGLAYLQVTGYSYASASQRD
jgi:hypothetical protein